MVHLLLQISLVRRVALVCTGGVHGSESQTGENAVGYQRRELEGRCVERYVSAIR